MPLRASRPGLPSSHGQNNLGRQAIAVGDPSYRAVEDILVAGAETDPPPPSAGDGGAAAHLHGPSQLFANVIGPQHPVASETPMACPYLPRLRGRYCVCWFMWSPSWTSGFEADVVPGSLR
jgi:hypothetical protein